MTVLSADDSELVEPRGDRSAARWRTWSGIRTVRPPDERIDARHHLDIPNVGGHADQHGEVAA